MNASLTIERAAALAASLVLVCALPAGRVDAAVAHERLERRTSLRVVLAARRA